MDAYKLDDQFKTYLKRVGYDLENMPAIQYQEIERAFKFGMATMCKWITHDLNLENEARAALALDSIINDCKTFIEKSVL